MDRILSYSPLQQHSQESDIVLKSMLKSKHSSNAMQELARRSGYECYDEEDRYADTEHYAETEHQAEAERQANTDGYGHLWP